MKLANKALTGAQFDRIFDEIDAGLPGEGGGPQRYYSGDPRSDGRAAARIVKKHAPQLSDTQAQAMVGVWIKLGLLIPTEYPFRSRTERGLRTRPPRHLTQTQQPGECAPMTTEDKPTGVYILTTFANQPPTVVPLSGAEIGTMRLGDRSYYLVPVEQYQKTAVATLPRLSTPIVHSATTNTVAELYAQGHKVSAIARKLNRSTPWVYNQLKLGGVRPGYAQLQERIEEILLDTPSGVAGTAFKDDPRIAELFPKGRAPVGPILSRMVKHGEVKRLADGRWVIA